MTDAPNPLIKRLQRAKWRIAAITALTGMLLVVLIQAIHIVDLRDQIEDTNATAERARNMVTNSTDDILEPNGDLSEEIVGTWETAVTKTEWGPMRFEYVFGRNGVLCVTLFDGEGVSSQPLYKSPRDSSQSFFQRYEIVADELAFLPRDLEPNQQININDNTLTIESEGATLRLERKSANKSVTQALAYAIADLKSAHAEMRWRAVQALRYAGPEARAGVPNLIAMMDSADSSGRQLALEALANIGPQEKQVMPALVEVLKGHEEPTMRVFAAREIGNIGPAAKAAVPALRECAQSSDESLAQSAVDALKRINPATD